MKKFAALLLIGTVLGTSAMAQTPAEKQDIRTDQKTLKNSIEDKKEDKKEVGGDLKRVRISEAVKDRKEVRHHRRSIHQQGRHLRRHGVKHPIHKAKVAAKKDKDAKKGKD